MKSGDARVRRLGRLRVTVACTALLAIVALLSGCTLPADNPRQPPIDKNPLTELIKPKVTAAVKDGDVGISPSMPLTVAVTDGKLAQVTLFRPDNTVVNGVLAPDGLSWRNAEVLGYNKAYRIEAKAYGLGGATTTVVNFKTSSPENLTQPYLIPGDGDVVGIAQPVAIQFDEAIPDRRAAEQAIQIITDPPVDGAFYWLNKREVRWRPEHFWSPGTKIKVDVNVYGKDLGGGLFGTEDVHANFSIGDAVVLTADDNTKQVTVERNGEVIRTMPTSMGKNDTPTDNGIYIVGDRFQQIVMDSSTYGVPVNSPQGYRTPVDWATRISYSGIFFHSAPWSVGQQGYSNSSHGCLNLSPGNAEWVFNNTKRGDVAIVKNTVGGTLSGTDGLGDWNIPWQVWKAGNAGSE
ncbi:L,D-transpeptidase family protein [Skermania sp. ID1734]|uniref:L,D-transpeptidase n=1 Tax=Skermania sp. ID1734 TaxID=2597516 RepID=UPI00117FA71A|nr:Ig-like domain-containing protein [Skermania sp. ID1734]TSD99967.1 L,D-transpeptidase family protein [Skermania sp. ID1734]